MVQTAAIGIDLGTTFSALARLNEAGHPEVVPNADGDRTTASAVYVPKDGPIEVGESALRAVGLGPDRVIRWAKREMGNPDWHVLIDGRRFSAVDVSGLVLSKLRKDAASVLGDISAAVVTVPAYFAEVQRKATMDAARLAGLETLRIINEPTAAALAYAAAGKIRGTALVYDLGGGTFDVSVVEVVSPTEVTVRSTEGDHRLGGYDFDLALARHLYEKFREEHGGGEFSELDRLEELTLAAQAEGVKRELSKRAETVTTVAMRGRTSSVRVDRETFERLTADLLTRTEMLVEGAMSGAGTAAKDLDAVILVGGSTRMPAVKRLVEQRLGHEPVMSINPDEAVALGASLQAGIILAEQGRSDLPAAVQTAVQSIRLQDVASHSYGTIALKEVGGVNIPRNDILIRKNTQIPASVTETYWTTHADQRAITCQVTQGEDEDPEFAEVLWSEDLELPPGRPTEQEIQVTFAYDANQRMSCDFLDVATGRRRHVTLDMVGQGSGGAKSVAVAAGDDIDFSDLDII